MLIAALTVVGIVSLSTLGVDRYPRIETPVVSVTTTNRGATPESIETEITDRIEAAVNTVAGIDELRSTSSEGQSRVTITFDLSKDADVAAQIVPSLSFRDLAAIQIAAAVKSTSRELSPRETAEVAFDLALALEEERARRQQRRQEPEAPGQPRQDASGAE